MLGTSTEEVALNIQESNAVDVANLDMLAATASLAVKSLKVRRKKAPKSLWTYETVLEPTGAASKYWDTDAPPERRTKRLAKEKLTALQQLDGDVEGLNP
jgi:hypothetical protein